MRPSPANVFGPGSIAMQICPHCELGGPDLVTEVLAQARLAIDHGFDGVTLAEHPGGFAGYQPDPVQLAGWLLADMPSGWVAPGPVILPLRAARLVARDLAWLGARWPGRVGVGVAAGALPADFALLGVPTGDLTHRFARGLAGLAVALRDAAAEDPAGGAVGDAPVPSAAESPVPLISSAANVRAARLAARHGTGLAVEASAAPGWIRQLTRAYRAAGGPGPVCITCAVWLGSPSPAWLDSRCGEAIATADADELACRVAAAVWVSGAESVSLRVHEAGVAPDMARDQIIRLGQEVLPRLRRAIAPVAGHAGLPDVS